MLCKVMSIKLPLKYANPCVCRYEFFIDINKNFIKDWNILNWSIIENTKMHYFVKSWTRIFQYLIPHLGLKDSLLKISKKKKYIFIVLKVVMCGNGSNKKVNKTIKF